MYVKVLLQIVVPGLERRGLQDVHWDEVMVTYLSLAPGNALEGHALPAGWKADIFKNKANKMD